MITPARIVLVVALALLAMAWWMQRTTAPPLTSPVASTAAVATPAATGGERRMPTGCEPLPVPPPLPAALTPASPTAEGVVQALDATLTDAHKAFLRCFPNEDDLVARVHGGLGRWLRNTLHLFADNPLTASLRAAGVRSADQMSGVLLRAYARSLNGQPINLPDAVARTKAPVESPERP
jgi:hypothetical protein